MNPMTNIENLKKLNERELELGLCGTKSSWHYLYRNSAWIFVGGLPYDLTEGDVICVFSQYGEIVNINMVRDKKTGKTKGFAFICFEDQRSTVLSVDNLNGMKLLGRTIRVDHVNDYKPPKEDDDVDDITRKLREEGCAPKLMEKNGDNADSDDNLLPIDVKEKKKKKKEKKEKKKKLKKDKRSSSPEVKVKKENLVEDRKPKYRNRESSSSPRQRNVADNRISIKTEKQDPSHEQYSGNLSRWDLFDRQGATNRHSEYFSKRKRDDKSSLSPPRRRKSPSPKRGGQKDRDAHSKYSSHRRRSRSPRRSLSRSPERHRRRSRSPERHKRRSRSPRHCRKL